MTDDRIEITNDDLDDVPEPPQHGRLEITPDDLLDVPDEPARAYPGMPGAASYGAAPGYAKAAPRTSVTSLLQYFLAGAIGGLIGWALTEPFLGEGALGSGGIVGLLFTDGFYFGIISASIGACFGAAEGLTARVWQKALAVAGICAALGFGGGFVGGIGAQFVYSLLGGGLMQHGLGLQVLARAVGWAFAGLSAGPGQGVAIRAWRKVLYGLLGGAAGGLLGGLLFDPIAMLLQGGAASRAVAVVVVGAFAGLGIGLVEEFRKQGWIIVTGGLLRGKQFILYKDQTTLGASPKCDIVLPKDPAVVPQHALIRAEHSQYLLQDLSNSPTTSVNGQPIRSRGLRDGDTIQIGATTLLFRTSVLAAAQPQPPYPPASA